MPAAQLMQVNPQTRLYLVDDFIAAAFLNTNIGTLNWDETRTGVGSTSQPTNCPDSVHQGVLAMSTGTSATGRTCLTLDTLPPNGSFQPYAGSFSVKFYVQVPVLSNATQRFQWRAGFGDSPSADFTNGIYFEYDDSQSLNWRIKTANSGTRTITNTSTVVTAGAWVRLGISTSNGSLFTFFINGVSVGTISTNIPTVGLSPIMQMVSSVGTTSKQVWVDYFVMDLKNASVR